MNDFFSWNSLETLQILDVSTFSGPSAYKSDSLFLVAHLLNAELSVLVAAVVMYKQGDKYRRLCERRTGGRPEEQDLAANFDML